MASNAANISNACQETHVNPFISASCLSDRMPGGENKPPQGTQLAKPCAGTITWLELGVKKPGSARRTFGDWAKEWQLSYLGRSLTYSKTDGLC